VRYLGAVLPFLISLIAVPADQTSVSWQETADGTVRQCSLVVEKHNPSTSKSALTMRFAVRDRDGTWTTERTDTASDEMWSEVRLAIPVRIAGSAEPQVLVKRFRPNWQDFELYSPTDDGIVRAFSFSCRDDGAVKWVTKNGALSRLVTFDRYAHPKRGRELHGDRRWQLRQEWAFDPRTDRWVVKASRWMVYRFGDGFGNPPMNSPADCRFQLRAKPAKAR
jgi:hypothetical protein